MAETTLDIDNQATAEPTTESELNLEDGTTEDMRDQGLQDLRDQGGDFDISTMVAMVDPKEEPSSSPSSTKTLSPEDAQEAFNTAAGYFDGASKALAKEPAQAIRLYETALKKFDDLLDQLPTDSPLRNKITYPQGVIYYQLAENSKGTVAETRALYDKALKHFETIDSAADKYPRAISNSAKQFIAEIPDDIYDLGIKLYQEAKSLSADKAAPVYEAAVKQFARSFELYASQGNATEARDSLKAIGINLENVGDPKLLVKTMDALRNSVDSAELKHAIQVELIKRLSNLNEHQLVIEQSQAYLKEYGSSTSTVVTEASLLIKAQCADAYFDNKDPGNAIKMYASLAGDTGFASHELRGVWMNNQMMILMSEKDYTGALKVHSQFKDLNEVQQKQISTPAAQQLIALVDVKANFFQAQSLIADGKLAEAYIHLSSAIKASSATAYQDYLKKTTDPLPLTEYAHIKRGIASLSLGGEHLATAVEDFQAASKHPKLKKTATSYENAAKLLAQAQKLYDQGDMKEALKVFYDVFYVHDKVKEAHSYAEKMIKTIKEKQSK